MFIGAQGWPVCRRFSLSFDRSPPLPGLAPWGPPAGRPPGLAPPGLPARFWPVGRAVLACGPFWSTALGPLWSPGRCGLRPGFRSGPVLACGPCFVACGPCWSTARWPLWPLAVAAFRPRCRVRPWLAPRPSPARVGRVPCRRRFALSGRGSSIVARTPSSTSSRSPSAPRSVCSAPWTSSWHQRRIRFPRANPCRVNLWGLRKVPATGPH